ncbi:MAG: cyclic nucleotide-binding domain-containing protein [Deltaproteobacteria bacterium]|nr:cyclic nucleotide-binding domain-containing protein [Deltaproteobacteria bacterium]
MDAKLYAKILALVPLLKSLSPDEVNEIMAISKLLKVRKGVKVVEEGEAGEAMYILVEGSAQVTKKLPNGESTPLAELKAPTVFGEMALIDREPRSASVTTLTDTVLFQVDMQAFNDLRARYRPAAFKVLRGIAPTICSRLRHLNDRIGEFFKNPESNLAELEQQFLNRQMGMPAKRR